MTKLRQTSKLTEVTATNSGDAKSHTRLLDRQTGAAARLYLAADDRAYSDSLEVTETAFVASDAACAVPFFDDSAAEWHLYFSPGEGRIGRLAGGEAVYGAYQSRSPADRTRDIDLRSRR